MTISAPDALRPERLADFAGQPDVTRELGLILTAAKAEERLTPHILLAGPPGLGKTTLAKIVSAELGVAMVETSAPALERPADITNLLSALQAPTVVFIDEIHALARVAGELLYPAMEDGKLDLTIGEGRNARQVRIPLAPFVLVGATTLSGSLTGPLRDRFGYIGRLRLYDIDDLASIVARSAGLLKMDLSDDAAAEIAKRSQGTPRKANNNLGRVRDYAVASGLGRVGLATAVAGLEAFGVDARGLDHLGREVLGALCKNFGGGPVGLKTLAAAAGEAPATLEEELEPYLMRAGLISRTPRGRMATPAAYEHLGLPAPVNAVLAEAAQESLFDGS